MWGISCRLLRLVKSVQCGNVPMRKTCFNGIEKNAKMRYVINYVRNTGPVEHYIPITRTLGVVYTAYTMIINNDWISVDFITLNFLLS